MSVTRYNVLFLCTGNSARSIIAECLLNHLGQKHPKHFVAYSAGSMPKGQIHPLALHVLKRQNFRVDQLRSKSWDEFAQQDAPRLDFVFTLCDQAAEEVCPVWPGQPMTAHWGLPDPAAAQGSETERMVAFNETLRMLTRRIELFINLPMESLDELTLQKQLDGIGRS